MKIHVFGAGGVGGYLGGRLAQAGEEVTFIARGEHLRAMQTGGLHVESVQGDFSVNPVRTAAHPAQAGTADIILVALKAWQIAEAAESLRPAVGPDTLVVPLANGVEAPEQLAAVLGDRPVLGGLCRISSMLAAPGHVRHTAIEPSIVFGERRGGPSPRAEALRAAFERAGVLAEVSTDISRAMWEKFIFIAALSGVGAVTRAPVGVLRSLPETRALLEQAMHEIAAVGRSLGVTLPVDVVARTLAFIDSIPAHTTTSMQRDIQEGRPSELDAQTGAVVRLSTQAGLSAPVNGGLYACLLPLEKRARRELAW
jgi:2-dehydropantoate 2-reductase